MNATNKDLSTVHFSCSASFMLHYHNKYNIKYNRTSTQDICMMQKDTIYIITLENINSYQNNFITETFF